MSQETINYKTKVDMEGYIKMDMSEICCAKIGSVELAQCMIHWWDFVLEMLKLQVLMSESYNP